MSVPQTEDEPLKSAMCAVKDGGMGLDGGICVLVEKCGVRSTKSNNTLRKYLIPCFNVQMLIQKLDSISLNRGPAQQSPGDMNALNSLRCMASHP